MQPETKNEDFDGILKAQKPTMLLGPKPPEQQKLKQSQVTAGTLDDLDLDKEILDQYKNAKTILDDILNDNSVAANQKAQVINTISSILQNIIKLQQELHNVERLKLIENVLIETLQNHETLKEAFLRDYKTNLEKLK